MVQRIGREHHTEAIQARRDVVREGRQPGFGDQHDGRGRRAQPRLHRLRKAVGVRDHHRQRFPRTLLTCPQHCHRLRVKRVAGQMKSAQPFDSHDATVFQHLHRRVQRQLAGDNPIGRTPLKLRAAVRARHRLGVKTSVRRVAVFRFARRAEREWRHGRGRAVIRHGADNGKTRAAVGAVNKRVTIAALVRIVHLRKARGTGGGIRYNLGVHCSARAVANGECLRQR